MALLEAAGVRLADVDLFAVAAGPGSFTGLRVGIATIQGLAVATGRRVVAVSTLDALAALAGDGGTPVAAWVDAHRSEVYASLYGADGRPCLPAAALPPAAALAAIAAAGAGAPIRFVGDGAVRYAAEIAATLGADALLPDTVPALAVSIARLAIARADDAVRPHAVVPIYVRRPDVELTRDRRAGAGA
jgi:tRNA threonylcarbamoyladenosine biosynthesis protein TsaB